MITSNSKDKLEDKLLYIKGDLISALCNPKNPVTMIAHQCNLVAGMGGGFAKHLAARFEELSAFDRKHVAEIKEHIPNLYDFNIDKYPDELIKKYIVSIYVEFNDFTKPIIWNIYSQISPGQPNIEDTLSQRNEKLLLGFNTLSESVRECLTKPQTLGIPLIASGLAADKKLKSNMTDLEYFKEYIVPLINKSDLLQTFKEIHVYHL